MGYLVNPTPTSQEEVAQTTTPTQLTGTTTSFTSPSVLSMETLQNAYEQLIQSPHNSDIYYFGNTDISSWYYSAEQAPHPLIAVLEQDYQKIQHILDSKESIVL